MIFLIAEIHNFRGGLPYILVRNERMSGTRSTNRGWDEAMWSDMGPCKRTLCQLLPWYHSWKVPSWYDLLPRCMHHSLTKLVNSASVAVLAKRLLRSPGWLFIFIIKTKILDQSIQEKNTIILNWTALNSAQLVWPVFKIYASHSLQAPINTIQLCEVSLPVPNQNLFMHRYISPERPFRRTPPFRHTEALLQWRTRWRIQFQNETTCLLDTWS